MDSINQDIGREKPVSSLSAAETATVIDLGSAIHGLTGQKLRERYEAARQEDIPRPILRTLNDLQRQIENCEGD